MTRGERERIEREWRRMRRGYEQAESRASVMAATVGMVVLLAIGMAGVVVVWAGEWLARAAVRP